MFDQIRPFFTTPPKRPASPLGAGMSDRDEPAIPAFQQAWKDGATFDDLFGPNPFTLHGSVGRSGADNHRPDVAKVETFLGDAGYYKPLTQDGPSGWHSPNLDGAIRSFQKDHGLEVDGLLKPGGPTIGKIGSLLGGGAPAKPNASQGPTREGSGGQSDMVHDLPRPPRAPEPDPDWRKYVLCDPGPCPWDKDGTDTAGKPPVAPPTTMPDRFPGHTISEAGAKEHDDWAKLLVRDSDPSQTARMLKVAIAEYGDQGRGDVADLLGRFHRIDPAKAKILHRVLKDSTGEDLPFRVAPVGEGFRELSDEEKLAKAPKSPFGSAQGADRWAAGNMAEVLLGKGDYADAIKHFRTDRTATMPYLAAVHERMRDKNPMQAMKFATQMQQAGLAMAAEAPEPPTPPTTQAPTPPVTQAPSPPPTTPAPTEPQPEPTTVPTPEPTPGPTRPSEPTLGAQDAPAGEKRQLAQGRNDDLKPTDKPVNPDELYKRLEYEADGDKDLGGLIKHPIDGVKGKSLADDSEQATKAIYGDRNPSLNNGEADAFRHALWSYKMAKELGADAAKRIGDGHERNGYPDGERLMDLFNNNVGRRLAADPKNHGRPDEEIIREAIKNGELQLHPFRAPRPAGKLSVPPKY